MKGQHFVIYLIMTSLLFTTSCSSREPSGEFNIPETQFPSMSDQSSVILERARIWIQNKVPYGSFDNNPNNDYYDGYRADCSGFVSYAWGLPKPGPDTSRFVNGGFATVVTISDLKPGDALNNGRGGKEGHIVIFVKWIDPKNYIFQAYEENTTPGFAHEIQYTLEQLDSSNWTIRELQDYTDAKGPYKAERLVPEKSSVIFASRSEEGPISSTIVPGTINQITDTPSPSKVPSDSQTDSYYSTPSSADAPIVQKAIKSVEWAILQDNPQCQYKIGDIRVIHYQSSEEITVMIQYSIYVQDKHFEYDTPGPHWIQDWGSASFRSRDSSEPYMLSGAC